MLWQALLSIIATAALWPTLEMVLVALTGNDSEKGLNGLQFLAIVFNWPVILIACLIVTFLLYKSPRTRYKTYLYYMLPTAIIMVLIRVIPF